MGDGGRAGKREIFKHLGEAVKREGKQLASVSMPAPPAIQAAHRPLLCPSLQAEALLPFKNPTLEYI